MQEAALVLLGEKKAFLTKSLVPELKSNDEWHYWTMRIKTKTDGEVLLYVPIDLSRFPGVLASRSRDQEVSEFVTTEEMIKWNSLSYDVRQQSIRMAEEAKDRLEALNAALAPLESLPKEGRSEEQTSRMREIQAEVHQCILAVSAVPRKYDPTTLDWVADR